MIAHIGHAWGESGRPVANPLAELVCAMIEDAVLHYRKFADRGLVVGMEVMEDLWPRRMARPIGGRAKGADEEIYEAITIDSLRWYPCNVRETVLRFLAPRGPMDKLLELTSVPIDGARVRAGLACRPPAVSSRNYMGAMRTNAARMIGVAAHQVQTITRNGHLQFA